MKALHFGAGNIGRGFVGKILSESGFDLIFADVNPMLIDAINYHKKYIIRTADKYEEKIQSVENIRAIHTNDPKIIPVISEMDVITTSVGFPVLDNIARTLSQGIVHKMDLGSTHFLNIIACENKIFASSYLKEAVLKNLPIQYHDFLKTYIGFVDCTVDSIIPFVQNRKKEFLFLIAEKFQEWIVNPKQFKGPVPYVVDMQFSNNLIAYIERKLFTLNTGHAIAAYLGLIKKYKNILEAVFDPSIRDTVKHAMQESGKVLIQRYSFDQTDHLSYINQILLRFENPFLLDSLERIGRNPLYKLGREERLLKPLRGTIEYQLSNDNLIKGIAAALHYDNKNDSESIKMLSLIKKKGIEQFLLYSFGDSINNITIESIRAKYISLKT